MRIVSLLPSATEILCAAGGEPFLVGRSHECDHPPTIAHLPALTAQRTAYDPQAAPAAPQSAADIDRQVREHRAAGLSLYTLDTDRLADLAPDLILTQDLCDVCSIDLPTVQAAARAIGQRTGREPAVLALNPSGVEGVLDDVLRVGAAAGLTPQARHLTVALHARMLRAQEFVNEYEEGPVVAFLEWTDPLFIAGHWTVQLIERAGGRHPWNPTSAPEQAGSAAGLQQSQRTAGKSIAVPPEAIAALKPEFLIVAPCGLPLEHAMAEARRLWAQPWFADLPAARSGRVAFVDGSAMFNRPGPRLIDAFEFLVGWLQGRPELIPEGFPWRLMPG